MADNKYWLGVDGYNYDLCSDDRVPTIHLTIGDMNLTLRDIPGVDSEVQLLDLEEHDQKLKSRFIRAWRRIHNLTADEVKELFEDFYVYDIMKKHSIDFIESVLDDYEKLEIGDEVQVDTGFGVHKLYIIVNEGDDYYTVLEKGTGYAKVFNKNLNGQPCYRKTGKHFDFIEQYCKKEGNE